MGKMKLIDGRLLVLVVPRYRRGGQGPVAQWNMPPEAFGCGGSDGFQVCTFDVSRQKFLSFGWIYDNEEAANAHARSERKLWRKHFTNLKRERRR